MVVVLRVLYSTCCNEKKCGTTGRMTVVRSLRNLNNKRNLPKMKQNQHLPSAPNVLWATVFVMRREVASSTLESK